MRISDWSSDVCSSDLQAKPHRSEAFRRACVRNGIGPDVRRPGPAHLGGHIERLIGTMIVKLRLLPGATGSNVAARDGYDADADAAMTLVECERWLLCPIGMYHHAPNRALCGLCSAQQLGTGRSAGRERKWQEVWMSGGGGTEKKTKSTV